MALLKSPLFKEVMLGPRLFFLEVKLFSPKISIQSTLTMLLSRNLAMLSLLTLLLTLWLFNLEMICPQSLKLEFKLLKCKHKWTLLLPKLIKKELSNKKHTTAPSKTTIPHLNCKA